VGSDWPLPCYGVGAGRVEGLGGWESGKEEGGGLGGGEWIVGAGGEEGLSEGREGGREKRAGGRKMVRCWCHGTRSSQGR